MTKEHPTEGYAAEYYDEHASFTDERFRDDYAFRVEFHPDMSEAQRKAITGMIEAGPKLLVAVKLYESGRGTPAMLHKAMSEALGAAELWIEDIPQAEAPAAGSTITDYTRQIEALDQAADQAGVHIPREAYHPDMELDRIALQNHAEVLRAAMGDRRAQQCGGYDWQEPGRIERALNAANALATLKPKAPTGGMGGM